MHALEPNPFAYAVLEEKAAKDSKLILYPVAAGTTDGTAQLFLHENHARNPRRFSTGSSLMATKPNVSTEAVQVRSLDFAKFLRDLGQVDFLKIDVEGYEVELIPHLVEARALADVSFVAVETHAKAKWSELSESTMKMVEAVTRAGLAEKFSWDWP